MKTLIFGGYSDDTFGEITPRGDDFDNCASGRPIEWLVESKAFGQRLLVVGQYAPGGASGWLIGIAPANEDDDMPIPAWPYRLRPPHGNERPHSPVLEVDVPDDATLRCLQRSNDNDED
jgi:hypothetical protein